MGRSGIDAITKALRRGKEKVKEIAGSAKMEAEIGPMNLKDRGRIRWPQSCKKTRKQIL